VPRTPLTIEEIQTLLKATPERIEVMTAGLTLAQLHTAPNDDEWSANEVLAHLRACADMWGDRRIVAMIAEDHPTIRAHNPRTWIKVTDYPDLEFRSSLRAFATQRAELLAALQSLPPEGWLRSATLTGAGKPFEISILNEASEMARHERPHIEQIERIVSAVSIPT
jgi:DinB superfamily